MSQTVNKVADPGVDSENFCGSISLILPVQIDFAEGAYLKWRK